MEKQPFNQETTPSRYVAEAALSVVIPVGESDDSWRGLLHDLHKLRSEDEVLIVSTEIKIDQLRADEALQGSRITFLPSALGRAIQLNAGARVAKNAHLWFLHCDSRFSGSAIRALRRSISSAPNSLHFFDLRFLPDGPVLMKLTQLGTWFRSRILRMPFGDQGLCISRRQFFKLGGFDEQTSYGEDHLLVWRAHQAHVRVKAVGHALFTSARKYKSNGWTTTTAMHLRRTAEQAAPQFIRLLRSRNSR